MSAFPLTTWRLLVSPAARGAWNMAVDEAILQAAGEQRVPPTLRLYAWQPACLSLGYAQPISDVDQTRLLARGWDLVRRPTGGRAILHTDELTYAVIAPHAEPRLAGGVLESYQVLAGALLAALHKLSVPAETQNHPNQAADNQMGAVCFEVPSNYEITVSGKKLLGSAQARRKEGILQHGTLPLYGDITRIVDVLEYPNDAQRALAGQRLLQRAITVESAVGRAPDWSVAVQAFVSAFEEQLNLLLQPGDLTDPELEMAQRILAEKYAHPQWTARH